MEENILSWIHLGAFDKYANETVILTHGIMPIFLHYIFPLRVFTKYKEVKSEP
jgi:hypothetical protein